MGLMNWLCLAGAYGVALVVSRGNPIGAAGFLLPAALVPALLLRRARPARPTYHAWTLGVTLLVTAGLFYARH